MQTCVNFQIVLKRWPLKSLCGSPGLPSPSSCKFLKVKIASPWASSASTLLGWRWFWDNFSEWRVKYFTVGKPPLGWRWSRDNFYWRRVACQVIWEIHPVCSSLVSIRVGEGEGWLVNNSHFKKPLFALPTLPNTPRLLIPDVHFHIPICHPQYQIHHPNITK